ncbi:MAG: Holliday junction branch migration protein RuvA [Bacillota bacterium]|nr:Holliday junction branch migration protein RuvA [Bacillota bacterium]
MLAYIKGELIAKANEWVIVEAGGIGYKIYVSANCLNTIGKIGQDVKVFTHLQVREDMLNLYGSNNNEEIRFFEILIQVSGIGPKGAISILGAFPTEMLQSYILEGNAAMLAKAPGVGKKTAQRLVLELKDKISKNLGIKVSLEQGGLNKSEQSNLVPAIEALEALGYSVQEANSVLSVVAKELGQDASVEVLIKSALKRLAQS